jgi:hypothetical protein
MASKDAIKSEILRIAGNPSSGDVAELADKWAEAIAKLDQKNSINPAKEVRVVETKETR